MIWAICSLVTVIQSPGKHIAETPTCCCEGCSALGAQMHRYAQDLGKKSSGFNCSLFSRGSTFMSVMLFTLVMPRRRGGHVLDPLEK